MSDMLELSDDELAFLRLTCDLFTTPESPLRFLDDESREPRDLEEVFVKLTGKKLLRPDGAGAAPELLVRLQPVSECGARVTVTRGSNERKDWYLGGGRAVEYTREEAAHRFGPSCGEADLAKAIIEGFKAAKSARITPLKLSSGDYLVFAVFARDVRGAQPAAASQDTMSIEEVLAYFDEPETKYVRTPSDDSWQQSVAALEKAGVLVKKGEGYELHPSYHNLAREIAADNQQVVSRLDFFEDQWLVRELNLYPAKDAVYRLGTQADGSVVIQELSAEQLQKMLVSIVTTLPNLLG